MSLLSLNSLPAERERGISFVEKFRTSAEVVKNGGTINGSPTIDNGTTLNGTDESITYNLIGNELNSSELSIVMEFYPDFDYDINTYKYLFDSTSNNISIVKQSNAESNVLSLLIDGNTIHIASATYSSYWNVGEKNTLEICISSGDNNVWLNGTKIIDGEATAWSAISPVNFYIGMRFSGHWYFDGKITKFDIFKKCLTEQEFTDYRNNDTFTYENDATLNLPMGLEQHDPTNTRSLDMSGNNNHATISGATKLTERHGYSFNGSSDYLNLGSMSSPSASFSITALVKQTNSASDWDAMYSSESVEIWFGFKASSGQLRCHIGGSSNYITTNNDVVQSNRIHAVTTTWDGTTGRIYVDGNKVTTNITGTPSNPDVKTVSHIGQSNSGSYWQGDIYNVIIDDNIVMTEIQIKDLHRKLMRGYNRK